MNEDTTSNQGSDSVKVAMAVMANDLRYVKDSIDKVDQKLSQRYVTKEELAILYEKLDSVRQEVIPLKKLLYGLLGTVGIILITAGMRLLLK